MKADFQLAHLAVRQAGYASFEQLDALGFSRGAIERRVDNGSLMVVRKGLYRVDGITGNHQAVLRAATAILPNATISHESAAELHGFPLVPRGKAVVTVHARTTHDFPGVTIHRSLDLREEHRMERDSMWWTTPPRTLMDLAATLHPKRLARTFDESIAEGLVTIEGVQGVFEQVARRGRTGTGPMRVLLEERSDLGEVVSATTIERVGFQVFDRGGLPRPDWQYPAPWNRNKRIDFAWPLVRVGCECDSRRWHTRMNDFQTDRDRDNLALIHKWRIFRFTWDDFTKRPQYVIGQLRHAIAA
jgi:hypothetical protein